MKAVEVHIKYNSDGSAIVAKVTFVDGSTREYFWPNPRLRREVFSYCDKDTIFKDDRA